ncbi:MAG: Holliday junction branch migration protein RuvA [Oscillospiraceae bacterium]|nr:Holliday junction branch migration protein RuvA [Oscillospiraceae bacterium]
MFYYLNGTVTHIDINLAVIDVGGVGYKVSVTTHTMSHLELNKPAKLYTYCHIKEDAFDIYGFHDERERRSFEMLLTVSGVGPKAALSIMSAVTPENLAMAILTEDEKALTAAPGIGKRIAQRIILELKDKTSKEMSLPAKSGKGGASPAAGAAGSKTADAAAALAVLGYSQAEINAAMRQVDTEALTVEEIIRQVLRNTMK